jgi:hypothetical protein
VDGHSAELLAVLKIFRVEQLAACLLRRRNDEAVVPAQPVSLLNADCLAEEDR